MTRHELSALTGAYALDALDEQERTEFEAHLAACADCAAEVRGLRAAAAELSQSTVTTPPPALRNDVLTSIRQIRPLPPTTQNAVPLRGRTTRRWLWPAVAAACAVIAIATAGWGYQQHQDANHNHAQATAITRLLTSPDAGTITGTVGSTGHATIVYSKARDQLVLIGHDIAAPAKGKTYQLWMIDSSGNATSAGLFTPDNNGNILKQVAGDLHTTASMGISVEPAGGSPQPTPGAIIAAMRI